MALTQSKFKAVAAKLFDKAKAGNLTSTLTLSKAGAYNPVTGEQAGGVSQAVDCIREDYQANEISGEMVKPGDYKLLVEFDTLTDIDPTDAGINATISGEDVRLVRAKADTAEAVWTLQMRSL
ncbi:MAG: hypothetical protein ACPHUL_00030 [Marinomonas gallaica]